MEKLVICCVTYNHAPYIAQALDSFLAQETSFDFKIVVHDDASTDGTTDIVRSYEARHPDKIKALYQTENQYSKGVDISRMVLSQIQAEYVALCDGDDYWTDHRKLQKQVDFLDSHPEYSLCFHPVFTIHGNDTAPRSKELQPPKKVLRGKVEFTLTDWLKGTSFAPTSAVVYRWRFNHERLEDFFPPDISPTDYFLHVLHAARGKTYYMNEPMAIHREHSGGIWRATSSDPFFLMHGLRHIRFYLELQRQFNVDPGQFSQSTRYFGRRVLLACLKQRDYAQLAAFADLPDHLYDEAVEGLRELDEAFPLTASRKKQALFLLRGLVRLFLELLRIRTRKRTKKTA